MRLRLGVALTESMIIAGSCFVFLVLVTILIEMRFRTIFERINALDHQLAEAITSAIGAAITENVQIDMPEQPSILSQALQSWAVQRFEAAANPTELKRDQDGKFA